MNDAKNRRTAIEDIPYIANSQIIGRLKTDLILEEIEYTKLRVRYKEKYPEVIQQAAKIKELGSRIKTEAEKTAVAPNENLRIAESQKDKAFSRFEAVKENLHKLDQKNIACNTLKMKHEKAKVIHSMLLERSKEMALVSKKILISSDRVRELIAGVKKKYDRVVLDCPPILAVSGPLLIASSCDGALFVAKFNKVKRCLARRSLERMRNAGIRTVGVIINDIDFESKRGYYYSRYYYQNRYYASYYQNEKGSS